MRTLGITLSGIHNALHVGSQDNLLEPLASASQIMLYFELQTFVLVVILILIRCRVFVMDGLPRSVRSDKGTGR